MTATLPDVDLEVDLDAEVVCLRQACDQTATWWVWASHLDGTLCARGSICDVHLAAWLKRAERAIAKRDRGAVVRCVAHLAPTTFGWEPL